MQTAKPVAVLTALRAEKRFDVESARLINGEYLQLEALRFAAVEYPTLPSVGS